MNKIITAILLASLLLFPNVSFAAEDEDEEKSAILIVSFGTSMPEARKAIDSLVNAAKEAFPGSDVFLSFTSNIIRRKILMENAEKLGDEPFTINKLAENNYAYEKFFIFNPAEALAFINDAGYENVYVMPTHMIPGEEYDEISEVVGAFWTLSGKYGFDELVLGSPFLYSVEDCGRMADILAERFKAQLEDKETAIILMGHGTPKHFAHAMYSQMQFALDKKAYGRFFLGTVEAAPKIEDVITRLKRHPEIKKLVLSPFMIVAGDHAHNDLAGDDEDSWLNVLKANGYENISTYLVGLGEDENIKKEFVRKIAELMDD